MYLRTTVRIDPVLAQTIHTTDYRVFVQAERHGRGGRTALSPALACPAQGGRSFPTWASGLPKMGIRGAQDGHRCP